MGKPVKFAGVDEELQKTLDADMDMVGPRRRAREAFKHIQLSIDHILFKVFGIARKLASSGYGVFALDYPGFGLSEGLHGYIPSFDRLVDDVIEHYTKVKEDPNLRSLPSFLFGQSMGGAVALKVHLKQPNSWSGAVLVAPMCKIADDLVPPWIVTQILIGVSKLLPKQKLVPQNDLAEMAFQDVRKREHATYNVIAYKHKPRLGTAVELLRTTQEIEHQLEKVSLPLLILHGKRDIVTDPSVSEALYKKASSSDKKLNLYDDAFHSLLEGEPDEMIATYNVIAYKHKPRLGTAVELLRTTQEIEHQLEKVSLPLLILHGKRDIVTDPSVSEALYKKASSSDKKLNLYDDAFHSLLEGEPDEMIVRVFGDIISWLDEHC
ncbi:caffeoylshikimate esterase [Dorcoceras hygrometricum]|uniref:Caffeoylshikimate esterase n=1 Tax=Dorcoceras hygrometricum TaxID=472368 RepID=A0A2Z7ACE5_9LAMI|nr:caffeoylshikimate esterase [Dorcoceras hygrometricum]